MNFYNRSLPILSCALLAVFMVGCGYRAETESETTPYVGASSMEEAPIVEYAVPQINPNIIVDLRGYSSWGPKEAAVKGKALPESFQLIDAQSGETVLSGSLNGVRYDEELKLYFGNIDFGRFTQEGTYYLQCDLIGQSYRFEIRERFYQELFTENYEFLTDQCMSGNLSVAGALNLLEAFEWYGSVFPDGDEDQLPDVLESLKTWVEMKEAEGMDDADDREAALYAAFLAKLSYNYSAYDRQYAADCQRRAGAVYKKIQSLDERTAERFFALTELYRTTGLMTYRNQIAEYKSFFESSSDYLEEAGYLYGTMTYMVTHQRVDVDMCNAFIDKLMNRAEEISKLYGDMIDPTAFGSYESAELIEYAVKVSCANYVMNIYQYTNIVEEFLHYLMGKNTGSMSFYEQAADRSGYILLLAQLVAIDPDSTQ